LGEGRGEDLAMEPNPLLLFLSERIAEPKEESFLFPVAELRPHPTLSQRERAVYLKWANGISSSKS